MGAATTFEPDTVGLPDADSPTWHEARRDRDLAARMEAARRSSEVEHATQVAILKARAAGQIAAARRAAEVALQAQETDLEMQAAREVEAAVRAEQVDAARMLVATMKQHDALVARTRAEERAEAARAHDQLTELKQQLAKEKEKATPPTQTLVNLPRADVQVTSPGLGLAELTGVVVLAGLAGSLIGWFVSLAGLV